MTVTAINIGGTRYRCDKEGDAAHSKYREMASRWTAKLDALEKEFDYEDAGLMQNYARKNYGKIKIEVRRTQ
jgi:hypothetical protein